MMSKRPLPRYLAIGKILAPWGIKGEVKVEILTDFPQRFALLRRVFLGRKARPVELEGFRLHKGFALLKFAGYDDRTSAESLRGLLVQIPLEEAMPLGEGEYYPHQIIGLEVWTEEGEYLGEVTDILFTGANEVCVVQKGEEEVLIPAVEEVVLEVDLEKGRMLVRLLEGLR